MALIKTITLDIGIDIESYLRVEELAVSKTGLAFNVNAYTNNDNKIKLQSMSRIIKQEVPKEMTPPPEQKSDRYFCDYDLYGANPYIQAYDYLKTLDQYKDAKDNI